MIARALAITRPDLRDGLRQRRQLVARALTPILLLAFLLALAFLDGNSRIAGETYSVAVTGEIDGATELIALLDANERIEILPVADPAIAAAEETDIALVLPADVDARRADGEPVTLVVYSSVRDKASNAAASLVESVLTIDRLDEGGGESAFDLTTIDVEATSEGARGTVAEVVTALILLQAVVLVGGAAARFAGRQSAGVLTTQLLLPLRPTALLIGKGVAELGVGVVAGIPLLALVSLVGVAAAATEGGAIAAVAAVVGMVVTVAVTGFAMVAIGLLIGVTTRSTEQTSLLSAFAIVGMSLLINGVVLGPVRSSLLALVPIAGSATALRQIVAGTGDPFELAVATLTTAIGGLLVLRVAAWRLDPERLTMRAP